VQSSRRLEAEAQRNLEMIWLTRRLAPDFKTIADFRRDNGEAIRKVCKEFVLLCRRMKLFTDGIVAIDGSKFKAVIAISWRTWPSLPRRPLHRTRSLRSLIAATTRATKSWNASERVSLRWFPSR